MQPQLVHTNATAHLVQPLSGKHGGKVVLVAVADAPPAAVVFKPVPALPLEYLLRHQSSLSQARQLFTLVYTRVLLRPALDMHLRSRRVQGRHLAADPALLHTSHPR